MKATLSGQSLIVGLALLILQALPVSAITFTSDTLISFVDTNYEGANVVVTNCTLTVDGLHSFASLRVLAGGNVTHSFSQSGQLAGSFLITNEVHVLSGTNAETLNFTNADVSSVVISDASGLVVYTNGVDYVAASTQDNSTTIQRTESSAIPDGGEIRASYTVTNPPVATGLNLTVAGDVLVAPFGLININAKGYSGTFGPGKGGTAGSPASGGGGGHAGFGGSGSDNAAGGIAYDSISQPVDKGSGGGNGFILVDGAGGGAVKLVVGGTLQINGAIAANGANGINNRAGGGAGGSIWLSAQTISGAGSISADGGNGEPIHGGGGGGGRIAIYSDTNLYSGNIVARGGIGFVNGGAGTIYTKTNSQPAGRVLADNGGRSGTNTLLVGTSGDDLMITGSAVAVPSGSLTFGNLLIASTGRLSPASSSLMTVTVTGDATVQSGGSIMADGLGSPPRTGSGAGGTFQSGLTTIGGGGGHGGYGAAGSTNNASGGNANGVILTPNTLGSGGGGMISSTNVGGAGGGAVRLIVNGTLALDGKISANGTSAVASSGGGGAGGSIWLTVDTITGSGSILANGGNGALPGGGGGGGGHIAIEYVANSFTGDATAYGGTGANTGGAGTIYSKQSVQNGQLLLDNGGRFGTNTFLLGVSSVDLTLRNGAIGTVVSYISMASLVVGSNSWLTVSGFNGTITATVTGNATIDPQGGIWTDGLSGNITGSGQTAPIANNIYGGGAGHGGYGGLGTALGARGGNSYGSITQPTTPGSIGGGSGSSFAPLGGLGGGVIRLTVNGTLTLNGRISSDGKIGSGNYAGGGSGGSVWLTVGTLSGSGTISANGGPGIPGGGGGGGGGRVAVYYAANLFSGNISAYGGSGFASGGAGTIYTRSNSQPAGLVLIDNGGSIAGTNTPLSTSPPDDFTIRGGAIAILGGPVTMRNLLISSNGWLTVGTVLPASPVLTILGDATVQTGGGIITDGKGSPGGQGTGNGSSTTKGGGGHGGYGGGNPPGTSSSGNVYGSIQSPTLNGSGGGNGSGTTIAPLGGAGGGAIRLTVTRTLSLSGRISADGLPGDVNSGGGSGGSVWLTAGTLFGTGSISANGGAGNGSGGGGGGRIALNYATNLFIGPVSAFGGAGLKSGGAGTIYTKANSSPGGTLLVDNGSLSGTNTPLSSAFQLPTAPFNLVVRGGAIVQFPVPPVPLLSNLVVSSSGLVTALSPQTNLELNVLRDVVITSSGAIAVDGTGFTASNGPGAGATLSSKGGGGGYGGIGGASASGAAGGTNYGSVDQPVDRGSGGGLGLGGIIGGSEGGGAIRLTVGGTLTVDGRLGANGNAGLQDDSGGGSGGSIWVTAHTLAGSGFINADGGSGELFGGGGGGGGRISLIAWPNLFNGSLTATGGNGASAGQDGTILNSSNLPPLSVLSQTPFGVVSNAVSSVDLSFNMAFNPYTADASDVVVQTPEGILSNNVTVSALNVTTLRVSFQPQTAVGDYNIHAGPQIEDLFGQPMLLGYSGAFTISLPVVQGIVTNINGQPVPGVVLQPNNGFAPTTTGADGNYTLGYVPGSTFTVTPSLSGFMFVPGTRPYAAVSDSVSNENYLVVTTIAPPISAGLSDTNLLMNWFGYSGVTYQINYSTNLLDWQPYGDPIPGSNVVMELLLPVEGDPSKFFRVQASD